MMRGCLNDPSDPREENDRQGGAGVNVFGLSGKEEPPSCQCGRNRDGRSFPVERGGKKKPVTLVPGARPIKGRTISEFDEGFGVERCLT